jgi:probable rRNA maturation factor
MSSRASATGPHPARAAAPKARLGVSLSLRCDHAGWKPLAPRRSLIRSAIATALETPPARPLPGAELSVLLTGETAVRALNRQWRGLDKPTNVLSFPAGPSDRISQSPVLGDIVLAYETVAREAEAEGKPLDHHLAHLVIHGVYHLLGDDHETEAEAERMEARETAALARMGIPDPYRDLTC